jgi:hypothetical protein
MWDRDRDQQFTWSHDRDGRCSAEIQDNGGRYGGTRAYRCPEPAVGTGWWFYVYPQPGHWVAREACAHHTTFLAERAWKVSREKPWVAPAS